MNSYKISFVGGGWFVCRKEPTRIWDFDRTEGFAQLELFDGFFYFYIPYEKIAKIELDGQILWEGDR